MGGETTGTPRKRWPLVVLASLSALAMIGMGWLAVAFAGALPQWAVRGVTTPLALKCLAVILVGMMVLAGLVMVMLRLKLRRSGRWGGDQDGSAALEMVLLSPLALMIFLMVVQSALLFNANMVIHYSAYCAARMAVVVVPADFNDDEAPNLVHPPQYEPSDKLERIRMAAVLALIPISASLESDTGDQISGDVHDQTTHVFNNLSGQDQGWFNRIKPQYDYANTYTKIHLQAPGHWHNDGNPDNDCPYNGSIQTGDWGDWGWVMTPWCWSFHRPPPKNPIWDFWQWEDLHVQVTYPFLLEVPYAARFLGEEAEIPGRTGRQYTATIDVTVVLTSEGAPAIRAQDYPGPDY
jgi:hypothetical protein